MGNLGIVALATLFSLSACVPAGAEPDDQNLATDLSGAHQGSGEIGEVDAHYFLSGEQAKDEFNVIEAAMARCMRSQGWEYIAEDLVSVFEPLEDSLEVRQVEGYGMVRIRQEERDGVDLQMEQGASPNVQIYLSLNESQRGAYATSKRDCEAAAMEELAVYKQEYANSLPVEVLEILYAVETGDHPDLRIAQVDWSACMKDRGWDAVTRAEFVAETEVAVDQLLGTAEDDQGSDADAEAEAFEISAAVDDWECFESQIEPVVDGLYQRLGEVLTEYSVGLPTYETEEE